MLYNSWQLYFCTQLAKGVHTTAPAEYILLCKPHKIHQSVTLLNLLPLSYAAVPHLNALSVWKRILRAKFSFFRTSQLSNLAFRLPKVHAYSHKQIAKLFYMASTHTEVNSAASRLQYERRRNANALPERGHIELIEPISAIITVEK